MPQSFDQYYYATSCGKPYERNEEWLSFFGKIAKKIKEEINPGKTLDAGCALGFLVEKMRECGIEAFGCDISEFAITNAHKSIQDYVFQASLTEPIQEKYDMIISIEVLEHMQKEDSEIAIKNLCEASNDILFSSTPFDYKESTHWNVQPPDYWSEQFAKHGFYRDVNFDASFITAWAVRYRKRNEPIHRLVKEYEQVFWMLKKENVDLRELATENEAQLKILKEQHQDLITQVNRLQSFENEIIDIKSSETWKLMHKITTLRNKIKK
ncbi:MAG: methyltransferase type 12 [Chloroflexi bacterium HGW-Chloroflexi-10]|nr:MAG: methyltransferase type 12 [Chloroflexi bacterium HGW-Chloroflexi-10]